MPDRLTTPRSWPRVLLCALVVGLLFATATAAEVESSGRVDQTGTSATVRSGSAVLPALLGFLAGAAVGGGIGALWGRRGIGGSIGFVLLTLLGGVAGLLLAGLLGAETRITTSENALEVERGARTGVLLAGGAVGLVFGGLVAWKLTPAARPKEPATS